MNTTRAQAPGRRGWVAGLALMSIGLPIATAFPSGQAAVRGGDPTILSDYRLTLAALILGIAAATGTLVFNRELTPAWLRWVSMGLATLGALIAAYLLSALVGTCGFAVLGGGCAP